MELDKEQALLQIVNADVALFINEFEKLIKSINNKDLEPTDNAAKIIKKALYIINTISDNKKLRIVITCLIFKFLSLYPKLIIIRDNFRYIIFNKTIGLFDQIDDKVYKEDFYIIILHLYYSCISSKYMTDIIRDKFKRWWILIIEKYYNELSPHRIIKIYKPSLVSKNKLEDCILNNNVNLFELNFDIKRILEPILQEDNLIEFKQILNECYLSFSYLVNFIPNKTIIENNSIIRYIIKNNITSKYAKICIWLSKEYIPQSKYLRKKLSMSLNSEQQNICDRLIITKENIKIIHEIEKFEGEITSSNSSSFKYLICPYRFYNLCKQNNAYEIFNNYIMNIRSFVDYFIKLSNYDYHTARILHYPSRGIIHHSFDKYQDIKEFVEKNKIICHLKTIEENILFYKTAMKLESDKWFIPKIIYDE